MKALLIVDVQRDFLKGGALAVNKADEILPVINLLMPCFGLVVASKDWHPNNHISFETSSLRASACTKWPQHCVQNTSGADFPSVLKKDLIKKVFYKGDLEAEESYSAFYKGEHHQTTGLDEFLKSHNVQELYIAGIVLEYCVKASIEDALKKGYNVWVIEDAIASFSKDSKKKILNELNKEGAIIIKSKNLNIE